MEDYETVTASGRFKVGIMLSVNQHEAERTSERIKFTFAEKRRRGEIISGNMPKGFKLEDGKPVKDPETEEAISAFWQSYLAGNGLKASLLAADAHGLHMAVSTGSFILRNARAYSGAIQGVSCDAYITPEQAELVLSTRKSRRPPSGNVYLFSGLAVCADCGGAMGAHRNTWTHKDGTEEHSVFYNCARRYRSNKAECTNSVNVMEWDIENRLLSALSDRIEQEAARLEVEISERKRQAKTDGSEKLRAKLERRRQRAWDAYLDETISLDDFKREAEQIDATLAAIKPPDPIDEDAPRRLRSAMPAGWRGLYAELDPKHRRDFWLSVLSRIEISPDRSIRVVLKGTGPDDAFFTRHQQPDGYWIEVIKAKE